MVVLILILRKEPVVKDNTKMRSFFKTLVCVLLVIIATASNSDGQNFIGAKSFVKNGTVLLRFVPNDNNTFKECKENGFIIKRISWERNTLPDTSDFTATTSVFYTKKYDKENKNWIALIKSKDEAGFLYNMLYKQTDNQKMDVNMAYGLAMVSCDFDVELAKAAGIFYTDENLPKGKYAYLILPTENKISKKTKPAVLVVNTAVDNQLKKIDSLKIETKKKKISLVWNAERLKSDYTGYFIERSEDNKNFVQLNKKPYIQIKSQDEKNKKLIYYNDTVPEYGKPFYYRIRGLGFFGVYGDYSNTVVCKAIKPMNAFPHADSTHLIYDSVLQVNWHMPKNFNLDELKGFDIYRANKNDGEYKKINKNGLSQETKSFTDYFPNQSNYYKVLAYSTAGDSAYSHAMSGLIPDIKPPKTPVGLKGKVDTSGNVILTWKPNTEKDLKGYRIFRNNDVNEELVEITKTILKDTVFKDTITLETLTEEVYYSITAVDNVYNNSPYATSVKLKRPDKIKPVAAQFIEIVHTDTTIAVKWICSTSKDAARYELWRSIQNKPLEKIKEWKARDSINQFTDEHLEYGTYYQYQLKVIDDDGNFSISNSASHYFDARIRKPVKKINYSINRDKRSITLNWEYPEKELYNFVIYKAKKGEPLKIVKTLKGSTFVFEDNELYIGNLYEYRIKANFNTGSESYMSDAVMVEF
jgi:hypothetical protein